MRIDREKIARLLEELKKRDERDRGMQPIMSLGCFYDLSREDDEYCKTNCCLNYETCKLYLKGFVEEESPFRRND